MVNLVLMYILLNNVITHWLLNPLPHYYISYTTCIYNLLLNYDVFIVGFNFILP